MFTSKPVKITILVILIILIIFGGAIVHRKVAAAGVPQPEKFYTSVRISSGDTLWTIAEKYHDASVSISDYVAELRLMNGIVNDGGLTPGRYITVWYYG